MCFMVISKKHYNLWCPSPYPCDCRDKWDNFYKNYEMLLWPVDVDEYSGAETYADAVDDPIPSGVTPIHVIHTSYYIFLR